VLRTGGNQAVTETDTVDTSRTGTDVITNGAAAVSAVFAGGQELVYAVYPDTSLYLFEGSQAPQKLATGILSVSAFLEPGGAVASDVVYANHNLYLFDAQGAHFIGGSVLSASTAFNGAQEVSEVVYTSGALYQFDGTGSHLLTTGAQAVSLAYNSAGQQVLDVVFAGGALYQYDATGPHQIGSFVLIDSITFDPAGQEVLEVIYTTLDLYQFDSQGAHHIATL
jgi:hypothetical protein